MKKIILSIFVVAVAFFCMPAVSAQESFDASVSTEVTGDDYVQVEFKDLPAETQELLVKTFAGYEFKTIYQHNETKLLKVIVVKEEVEKTFIQNAEGNFEEQI
jgi:hypothetical protein